MRYSTISSVTLSTELGVLSQFGGPLMGLSDMLTETGGIVLCGGHSRRMGKPKEWLVLRNRVEARVWHRREAGETLLQHCVGVLSESLVEVVVAARVGQVLPPLPGNCRVVRDAVKNRGPLQGMAAGFDALVGKVRCAFVLACDQPFVNHDFIVLLHELKGNAQAAVVGSEDKFYPLAALYDLTTREMLNRMLATGEQRVMEFVRCCKPRIVTQEELKRVDPDLLALRNINDDRTYQNSCGTGLQERKAEG